MRFHFNPMAAAVLALHALPSAAQEAAGAAPDAVTQLREVKVQADAPTPYKAEAVSSPKFTEPLVNTPQTISVVTKDVIAEQGALSLSEALRNTPGITFQLGENGNTQSGDAIFMRGFDTQGSIFLDNIRDLGPAVRDVFNIEQIEIVKGPAGADNGRGVAAGYINLVSKTPLADNAYSGSLGYGDEQRRRVTADLNQQLGAHSAARLNLLGQDGGVAGRDVIERRQWGVAPSLAFGLGTDTRITLFSQHIRQDNTPDGGIPAIGISGYRHAVLDAHGIDAEAVDTDNFYGLDSDFEDIRANLFTARIEHDLTPGLTIRNLSRYGKATQRRVLTAPLQAPVVSDDPDGSGPLPAVVRADPADWTQGRSRQASYRENQILTNQTQLTARFATGAFAHAVAAGAEFIYEAQDTPSYALVSGQTQAPASLYAPKSGDPAATLAPNGVFSNGDTTTLAAYLFDTVKFAERWQLNGGLRVERYETETDSTSLSTAAAQPSLPVGTPVPAHRQVSDNLLSWKLGLLYKPAANGSVYVAYANSLRPPGGDNFTLAAATPNASSGAVNISAAALDPQEARSYELGSKWDLLGGRLAATAALFKTENTNDLARADPADPDRLIQYGKKSVEGVELGLVGQLTPVWQLSFGYTYQDTKVDEGAILLDGSSTQSGAAINFSPKNSATLWTRYALPFPLTIGAGARYVDSQARTVNNDPGSIVAGIVEVDHYWVFDAMAQYELTRHVDLQLNVYNLADEDYVASVNNSGHRYFPGTPRSYLMAVNLKF